MSKNKEQMIYLSLDETNVALACALNDITASEFGEMPDYRDVAQMTFYMQRAALVLRLRALMRAHGEVV